MFSTRIPAARLLAVVTLCSACVLLFAGCSLPWQHSNAQSSGAKPTTQQLLAALQKNFRSVSAFHVVMQANNTGTAATERIQILNANGDVVMPDKVKAQATVILSGQSVTVNLVSIGSNQFITDPITGQWRVIKGLLDSRTLTDPHTGLSALVGKVQNLSQPSDDSVNGVPCWRMTGQLDAKYLAFFTGGGVPPGTMLSTTACIGKTDMLPYQLKVTGKAAVGDLANTSRTFLISNYNENISITAPQI
jgi:LppX_LprAFG lipoprotein